MPALSTVFFRILLCKCMTELACVTILAIQKCCSVHRFLNAFLRLPGIFLFYVVGESSKLLTPSRAKNNADKSRKKLNPPKSVHIPL